MTTRIRFATLAVLLAAALPGFSDSPPTNTGILTQPVNPNPKNCKCIDVTINGHPVNQTAGQYPSAIDQGNGTYELPLTVKVKGTNCSKVKITSITVDSENGAQVNFSPPCSAGSTSYEGKVVITGFIPSVSQEPKWNIVVKLSGDPDTDDSSTDPGCIFPFTVGGGCKACKEGCSSGATPSASQESGSCDVNIPMGESNGGDTGGSLRFHTMDLSNPGPAGVAALVPSSFTINRTNDVITSVVSPVLTMALIAAPTQFDPHAFTITNTLSGATTPFRTTTISLVEDNGTTFLRTDSTYSGATFRFQQSKTHTNASGTTPASDSWLLESGPVSGTSFTALRKESLTITTPQLGTNIHRVTVQERVSASSAFATVADTATTWNKFAWGWEMTKEVIDPAGEKLTSTWTYYQPGETTNPNASTEGYGMLKSHTRYDGHQEIHTYWLNNHQTILPFAADPQGLSLTRTWNPGTNTLTTTRKVGANTLSEETQIYNYSIPSLTTTVKASGSQSLTTVTVLYPYGSDFGGQPKTVTHPDGTVTTYTCTYSRDTSTPPNITGKTVIVRSGLVSGTTTTHGTTTTTVYNAHGTPILGTTTLTAGTNSITTDSYQVTAQDAFGRAETTSHFGDLHTTSQSYNCCGVATSTDMHGETTFYAYDGLRRQIKSNTRGVTNQTTRNGLTIETRRYPEAVNSTLSPELNTAATTLVGKTTRNLTSTSTTSESPDPSSTTAGALVVTSATAITYQPTAGLSTRSVTTVPGGASQTTDSFLDGTTATTTGSLAPNMTHGYAVNATGLLTTTSYLDGTTSKETTTSQTDWAGRGVTTTKGTITQSQTYNTLGQLEKTTDADNVSTLYAYNDIGERTTTAVDINGNGEINFNGTDRITVSTSAPGTYSGFPVMSQTTQVYATNGSDTPTTVSTSHRTPDGLRSWSLSPGVDNPSTRVINPSNWEETTTNPDGTKTISTYTGGRLISTEHHSSLASSSLLSSVSYGYDSLGRPFTSTDSRTGTTTTAYVSATCDAVLKITDSDSRVTSYGYDSQGRRITTTLPDNSVTNTSYYPDGQVKATWGSQTYPAFTTYDYAGRQKTLRTQPTLASGIPTDAGGSVTAWNYSTSTGHLLSKLNDAGKGAIYSYTPAGRLATRTWARTVGNAPLNTAYGYSAGQLTTTDYSDTTPDVTVTHNRLGQPLTITQANQSRIANTYDPTTLAVDTETVSYDIDHDGTYDFSRVLDRSQDTLGRSTGYTLGTPSPSSALEAQATYSYSSTDGRLASVSDGTNTFTYNYLPNSNLIEKISGPIHDVNNAWEPNRNVLASKQNKVGTTVISQYDYTVTAIGQRTNLATSGSAFPNVPSWLWGYDSLGQVISADSNVNTSDRTYQYDTIGNRLQSGAGVSPAAITNYTANALNQYSQISNSQTLNPSYDDDGNATAYPLPAAPSSNSALAWDAENRLVSTTVNGTTTTYLYDAQSRRITKTVGTGGPADPTSTLYVYDGFNCIAEYSSISNSQYQISKSYLWGLDLSGSMQGAGGVGGLLAEKQGANLYYPTFDGNGNVSEYLAADGSIAAHFEYDPFGNTVVNTDSGNLFNYRFSTKPLDQTTGLYYYGYRYYDPVTGRWPSRDPIEEEGGLNLYGFVGNDGINHWDTMGLLWYSDGRYLTRVNETDPKYKDKNTHKIVLPQGAIGLRYYSIQLNGNGDLEVSEPNPKQNGATDPPRRNHELHHIESVRADTDHHFKAIPYKQVFCSTKGDNCNCLYYKYNTNSNQYDLLPFDKSKDSLFWLEGTAVLFDSYDGQKTEEWKQLDAEIKELGQLRNQDDDIKRRINTLVVQKSTFPVNNKSGEYEDWVQFKKIHMDMKINVQSKGWKFSWKDKDKVYPELQSLGE